MGNEARELAVVTGASSGIGLELAKIAAAEGYDLIIAADEPTIETAAQQLRSSGVTVDATDAGHLQCNAWFHRLTPHHRSAYAK